MYDDDENDGFDENGNQIGPVELTEENVADIAKKLNSYKF